MGIFEKFAVGREREELSKKITNRAINGDIMGTLMYISNASLLTYITYHMLISLTYWWTQKKAQVLKFYCVIIVKVCWLCSRNWPSGYFRELLTTRPDLAIVISGVFPAQYLFGSHVSVMLLQNSISCVYSWRSSNSLMYKFNLESYSR
jgi:hypothetical protein